MDRNPNILESFKGNIISEIDHSEEDVINISFKDCEKKLRLCADQDCCSVSWFELKEDEQPLNTMIGKQIKNIQTLEDIEMPVSNRQECDQNLVVGIEFEDNTQFKLILRNSSNGYYSGWLDLRII